MLLCRRQPLASSLRCFSKGFLDRELRVPKSWQEHRTLVPSNEASTSNACEALDVLPVGSTAILDIETNGLLSNPDLALHCAVVLDPQTNQATRFRSEDAEAAAAASPNSVPPGFPVSMLARHLKRYKIIVAHNGYAFDMPALKRLLDCTHDGELHDTLVMARLKDPDLSLSYTGPTPKSLARSHSLRAWGHRLNVLKGDFGQDNEHLKSEEDSDDHSSAWAEWSPQMEEYCEQDVRVTAALYDEVKDVLTWASSCGVRAYELELSTAEIIHEQCSHGVLVNPHVIEEITVKARAEAERLKGDMLLECSEVEVQTKFTPKKTNEAKGYVAGVEMIKKKMVPFNPSSVDHLRKVLTNEGWVGTEETKGGKKKLDAKILSKLDIPLAKLATRYKLIENVLAKVSGKRGYVTFVDEDNRIRPYINSNGTVTGRMTHYRPNFSQVPKKREDSYCSELVRQIFVAPPSKFLVGYDADALELRMLAHYLAEYDNGTFSEIIDEGNKANGTDIHSINQEVLGLPTRDAAKVWIYAWLYGAGPKLLGSIAIPDASETAQLKQGKEQQAKFFKKFTAIGHLKDKIGKQAQSTNFLHGLDGRKLRVRSSYSALNVQLQSAGAIVMKVFLVNLHRHLEQREIEAAFVLNVHDEVQAEVAQSGPDGMAAVDAYIAACDDAMNQTRQDLALRVPLKGEGQVGQNWSETH